MCRVAALSDFGRAAKRYDTAVMRAGILPAVAASVSPTVTAQGVQYDAEPVTRSDACADIARLISAVLSSGAFPSFNPRR